MQRRIHTQPPNSNDYPLYISSRRYCGGNWTAFRSSTVAIFEILPIQVAVETPPLFAVLYTSPTWHLALASGDGSIIESFDLDRLFDLSNSHADYDDMIYTDLYVDAGSLWATVTYVSAGSGGNPEIGGDFRFDLSGTRLCYVLAQPADEAQHCGDPRPYRTN